MNGGAHGRVSAQSAAYEKGARISGEGFSLIRMESSLVALSQFVQLTALMIEHGRHSLDRRRTSHWE